MKAGAPVMGPGFRRNPAARAHISRTFIRIPPGKGSLWWELGSGLSNLLRSQEFKQKLGTKKGLTTHFGARKQGLKEISKFSGLFLKSAFLTSKTQT
jgi:hypothetical protein